MGIDFALDLTAQMDVPEPVAAPTTTPALYVEEPSTAPRTVQLRDDLRRIVTRLRPDIFEAFLAQAGVAEQFHDVVIGLREGFTLGLENFSLSRSYTPDNHAKLPHEIDFINSKYAEEIALGRISQGYSLEEIESVVGFVRTAPLSVVESRPKKFRVITNHSFPRSYTPFTLHSPSPLTTGKYLIDPSVLSPNALIDTSFFQCGWGTFAECYLLVADATQGTEVAVFDVDAAFRNVPLHPSIRCFLAVKLGSLIHLDTVGNFGASSMPGVWGRIADAMVHILLHVGVEAVLKWVDDFIFFRYPRRTPDGIIVEPYEYSYDSSIIWDTASALGWPWALAKYVPFSSIFQYIGFLWDLLRKFVSLPEDKRTKYLGKLQDWTKGSKHSRSSTESLIGTLNHICLIVPEGYSHMPSLYRFRAHFREASPSYLTIPISNAVVTDIQWWTGCLQSEVVGMPVLRRPEARTDFNIFVDASTSWGIGIVINGRWLAFEFKEGWRNAGREIGWAEMVAIELVARTLVTANLRDTHVIVHSDNQGVVSALKAGYSRGIQQNHILREIVRIMQVYGLWLTVEWIPSADNPADDPSRGRFPSRSLLYPSPPKIPPHLVSLVNVPVSFQDYRLLDV